MRNLRRVFLLAAVGLAAQAQTWDTSGNGMLSGTYYFRQVIYVLQDQYGDLGEAVSLYGNIKFDGNGGYTLTSGQWLAFDSSVGTAQTGNATGTYSISASGYGFVSNPYTGDSIYGLVSQQGVFVGSSTDNPYRSGLPFGGYNDFFVAAPLASPLPTAANFSGTYVFSNLDLVGVASGQPAGMLSMMFTLTANGACGLGNTVVTGYAGTTTTPVTQTSSLPTCLFSNGAAVGVFQSGSGRRGVRTAGRHAQHDVYADRQRRLRPWQHSRNRVRRHYDDPRHPNLQPSHLPLQQWRGGGCFPIWIWSAWRPDSRPACSA